MKPIGTAVLLEDKKSLVLSFFSGGGEHGR